MEDNIKHTFTQRDQELIIQKYIPEPYKLLYEVLAIRSILDHQIKVKVRIKCSGEVMNDTINIPYTGKINF